MDIDTRHTTQKEESLISPFIGRPNFPERILEEIPDLTVREYLRYSVTGELPERISSILEKDTKKFIETGLKNKRLPAAPLFVPEDYLPPETVEDLAERIEYLEYRIATLIEQEAMSFKAASALAVEIRCTKDDARLRFNTLLESETLVSQELELSTQLHKTGYDAETRASAIALVNVLRGSPHLSELLLTDAGDEAMKVGQVECLAYLMEFEDTRSAAVYALQRIEIYQSDPDQLVVLLNTVLPLLDTLQESGRRNCLEGDHVLGTMGTRVANLVVRSSLSDRPLNPESLSRISTALCSACYTYLKGDNFLCHVNAIGLLKALNHIHGKAGAPVSDEKIFMSLLNEISEKKVKDYPKSYRLVADVKEHIRTLYRLLEGKDLDEQMFSRSYSERAARFLRKCLPSAVYNFFARMSPEVPTG